MWRKRSSPAPIRTRTLRGRVESTGPTIGRPSAVAVASEADHALQALGDLLGGEALSGAWTQQSSPAQRSCRRGAPRGAADPPRPCLRPPSAAPPPAADGADRRPQRLRARIDHRRQPELARLREAAVGVGDGAQLAGQAELAEAGDRPLAAAGHDAARGARDRERDREVGARLVDPHAAGDVDEHVGAADADAGVARRARRARARAGCGRSRWRPAAAARARTARRAPGPRPAAAASPPSPPARRCRARASPRRRSAPTRRRPRPGRRWRISNTPTSLVEPKRFLSARSVR